MKIVFFGASKYVLPILEVLRQNFDLVQIVTTESLPTEPVSAYAAAHAIPLLSIKHFTDEAINTLHASGAPLAVLAYFGLILPDAILTVFPKGIINIHPSLLPLYRGPTPGQSALLASETTTGVSIILLDQQVDHGPLLIQTEEQISPTDNADTLYTRLFTKGASLLPEVIKGYIDGTLKPQAQDHARATFTKRLRRESGFFDSTDIPSQEQLDRMIKAYYPWPGVWTTFHVRGKAIRVKFLPDKKVHPEGKKPMSYKDFLNGYPEIKDPFGHLFS